MSEIVFEPWVGDNYAKGIQGKKVLVLGESHYDEGFNQGDRLTEFVVRRHIERVGKQYAFWTNIAKTFVGPAYADKADRVSFWESVAFYNYVQEFVGDGPRQRPTKRHFQESWPEFSSVIEELRPDLVVALGFGLWDSLQPLLATPVAVAAPAYHKRECAGCWLQQGGRSVLVGYIKHPSGGYDWEFWRSWCIAYLKLV